MRKWVSTSTARLVIFAQVPSWGNVAIKQDCTGRTVFCSCQYLFLFPVPFLCYYCMENRAWSWNEYPKWGCSDNEGIKQLREKAETFLVPLLTFPWASLLTLRPFHIHWVINSHAISNVKVCRLLKWKIINILKNIICGYSYHINT